MGIRIPDVLIIGAGSAGSVIANRLSADPARSVLVVESGGRVVDPDMRRPELWPAIHGRDYDWAYRTTPQRGLDGRSLEWARGKGLGGSSLIHAMAHMRGCRADFDRWVDATGDGRWSYDALIPFFDEMDERLHVIHPEPGLSSPLVQDYLSAWESLGVRRIPHHNTGEMIGATANSLTIDNGRRVTAADGWLDPVLDRANLEVLTEATVVRLIVTDGRAIGAELVVDGTTTVVHAGDVVLAAGSLGDAMLAMRSGIGDPDELGRHGIPVLLESPEVGRNLHDHLLGAGVVYRSARPVPPTRLQLSESMTYLSADGLDVQEGPADIVVGCVVAPSASERFDPGVPAGEGYTLLFGVTNPDSRGSVRLSGPAPDDAPVLDPQYLTTEHDRAMFRSAFRHARLVGGSEGLAPWRRTEVVPGATVGDDDAAIDAFIASAAITHHHPVGTMRMGKDDAAPVRPDLRFRGLEGLHVADAAVIPSITAGPVHASVLAIAESFSAAFTG
ncbi:GMC family oxidoreductase N-terminal domain-containing protein [soil metagenome]